MPARPSSSAISTALPRAIRQRDRFVEQLRVPGGGEPHAFLTWRRAHEVVEYFGWRPFRILLEHGAEPGRFMTRTLGRELGLP